MKKLLTKLWDFITWLENGGAPASATRFGHGHYSDPKCRTLCSDHAGTCLSVCPHYKK